MDNRQLFLRHLAQTSEAPLGLEISRAEGSWLYASDGKKYLDLIGGISVCHIGHRHPRVVSAIRDQIEKYLHVMVYGELIQSPQVRYARMLTEQLPPSLDCVYFTNSGAEAVEGAMKLAKRVTGRPGMLAFLRAYHGSTQGALSLIGDEYWRQAFRPLLPGIRHLPFNDPESLNAISDQTACVLVETIQAEAGVILPVPGWLPKLQERCRETGALLILDEIQCGFGRNGSLWAFPQFGIEPDILLLGKALGGGMPLGAFLAGRDLMKALSHDPLLGHITTFGGHPVSCAAGLAGLEVLLSEGVVEGVEEKGRKFREGLAHPGLRDIRQRGLMIALEFDTPATCKKVIDRCLTRGLFTDWFLFAPQCLRIVPPLTIRNEEIDLALSVFREVFKESGI